MVEDDRVRLLYHLLQLILRLRRILVAVAEAVVVTGADVPRALLYLRSRR